MDDGHLLWQIILQLVLILLNAIFACAEIAVISMKDARLAMLSEEGNKRARRLTRLTREPARFLATIQVAITLSGFMGSAFAADNFSEILVDLLVSWGVKIPVATLDTVSVIVITLILSFLTLVFGELVPKRLAMKNPEKIALGISGLVAFISKLFAPVVWLLTKSTNGVLRLCGVDPNQEEEQASEEEIRMIVDASGESGEIDPQEQQFINNVFEFDDISAGDIMTHRTEVSMLWLEEDIAAWHDTVIESRHAYYPIVGESADDVEGILCAEDYFRLRERTRENIMQKAVIPPYFVPESVKADVLFRNMKKSALSFAVVLDEHGGMSGVVTMNDLLEELVGGFEEETVKAIERVDSNTWSIHGEVELDELAEALGINLDEVLEDENFATFDGLVFNALGEIPEDGTVFEVSCAGMQIKVTELRDHQIEAATVCLDPVPDPEEKDKDKDKDKEKPSKKDKKSDEED